MKVAYHGYVEKEEIKLQGVYVSDRNIDTKKEEKLSEMIANPEDYIKKLTRMEGYKYIKEDDVDSDFVRYIRDNRSIKINDVECYIHNTVYNTTEERLDVYTNYVVQTLGIDEDDYDFMVNQQIDWWMDGLDRLQEKNKELLEAKLKSEEKRVKDEKRWYQFWK
ncbi:hypothetical protein [Priestia megaterium]|uniref:hypothetical protein n=1 Tax=Priestia megaterium TaxID=1404 RepID=UPI0028776529|nr:hypothetical protein [Priestia megaterium]